MIASVNKLTGDESCTEAIIAQQRPDWVPLASWGAFAVIYFITIVLAWPFWVTGLLAGAGLAAVLLPTTSYWIVARTGDTVTIARSSRLLAKALEIVSSQPAPVDMAIDEKFLTSRATIDGKTYVVAKQFMSRLRSISSPSPAL